MIKFGKPHSDVLNHKTSFFSENDRILEDHKKLFKFYGEQPLRKVCKNCCFKLNEPLFKKQGIDYILCKRCNHLNGAHEDTDAYCSLVYTIDEGREYGSMYITKTIEKYNKRVNDIYIPKAEFLIDALKETDLDFSKAKFADFGAGSGYFVTALQQKGLINVKGYEVSKIQADFANNMIRDEVIIHHELSETISLVENVKADVVSLIGVLEHLQNPRGMLTAICNNKKIKYIYLSLPLFSSCVFYEILFSEYVMSRQLVPAHTHLYSEHSIEYFCNEFGLTKESEWWFGTDILDIYRNIWIMLEKNFDNSNLTSVWNDMEKPMIDNMQLAMDKKKGSSEVHILLKIQN